MKPQYKELCSLCPEVDEDLIRQHLTRLQDRYFNLFDQKQICKHLCALSRLSSEEPVQILITPLEDRTVECTILAFDYPAEFSVITGILASSGLNILSGDIFTYERTSDAGRKQSERPALSLAKRRIKKNLLKRRRIIDHLSGNLESSLPFEIWENRVKKQFSEAIRLLERESSTSLKSAKQMVNELVAERLNSLNLQSESILYPVHIEVDNEGTETKMKVVTQDTPFFLYALSTALALRGISIEYVRIRTIQNRVEDEFSFLDSKGRKILKEDLLNQVKLSVLLTKQFTYFLGNAPDPYAALYRFEQLVEEIITMPEQRGWLDLLSNPFILQDLARLLGASDFLWEEFIRLQYETLLPMLEPHIKGESFSQPLSSLKTRLEETIARASSLKEKYSLLNEFKDREIYLFDLDHILNPEVDFNILSDHLTFLAETVVNKAVDLTYEQLTRRYGTPRTIAGLDAHFVVLGLGKLGGGDLGYASDIELLFVYSDNGFTDGEQSITNLEFFNLLARRSGRQIQTKREGIFHVDLRLRPHGAAGPQACSMEAFCQYYGLGGEAHSLERLALVRMRAFGGDRDLGARIERLRDEFIYSGKNIDLDQLRRARQKQLDKKTEKGRLNAKFSRGALVDLEYTVQLLQVLYGREHPELRTVRMKEALRNLADVKILTDSESERISGAYRFFRKLINSLRMLRGSAKDLFLPDPDSNEYIHLARRMSYSSGQTLSPGEQLHLDFETYTATIRVFVEQHLGRESLPGPAVGNVADLILSDRLPIPLQNKILTSAGFKQPERAYTNLRSLAGADARRSYFARLAVLAVDLLKYQPDPDMALNNWERFIQSLENPEENFRLLLSQPKRLEILLSIFAGSQFLSDALIRNPEFFTWATRPEHLHRMRELKEIETFFTELSGQAVGHAEWLNRLRIYKRREILRIGIRDIFLEVPIRDIMQELSMLAEAILKVTLNRVWKEMNGNSGLEDFCILALGKLGGCELNYSSDIDILGVTANGISAESREQFSRVMEKLVRDLSSHSEEGYTYRVDLRLRPYGRSGELVSTLAGLTRYFTREASLWEIQALLKVRPVAGSLKLGEKFMEQTRSLLLEIDTKSILRSIGSIRQARVRELSKDSLPGVNIKLGAGGIRDTEFLVQGLQLINFKGDLAFLTGNTLKALDELKRASVFPALEAAQLKRDYLFLRRIEHFIQIFEDRQTHTLPKDPEQLAVLAKRMLGVDADADQFSQLVSACLRRIQDAFTKYILR